MRVVRPPLVIPAKAGTQGRTASSFPRSGNPVSFRRSLTRFLFLSFLLAAALPAAAQRKASEKDSIAAQTAAVMALRQFLYQFGILVDTRDRGKAFPFCEIAVSEFCYGPLNAGVVMGGIGSYPAQRTLAASNIDRIFRRRWDFYVTRYMTELQRAQKTVPGDRWINAELMRMHMEHGYLGRAENAVAKCKDADWWCAALGAYVLHSTGAWQSADSAWSLVLARMTPEERCEWLDPSAVMAERRLRRAIEEYSCAQLEEFSKRFWWLSDPAFSKGGNERRSAHLSRVLSLIVDAALQDRVIATPAMVRAAHIETLNPVKPVSLDKPLLKACANYGGNEPASQRAAIALYLSGYPELVLRVGVPLWCAGQGYAQYPLSRQSFVPHTEAALDHLHSLPTDWNLRDPWAYEFISGWTRTVMDLTYQAAYFKRADSSRLVIASELPVAGVDGILRPATYQTRTELSLQSDFDAPRTRMTTTGTARIFFNLMVGAQTFARVAMPSGNGGWRERTLASIESDHARGPLGRVRFATGPQIMPAQRVTLSDALLFEEGASLPSTVEQAAARARPNTTFRERSTTGVFWEVYGLLPGETPRVSILIVRQEGREPLRLGRGPTRPGGPDVVSNDWDEPPVNGAAIEPRSLNLSLATLRRGTYTLSVAVSVPGQELVESVRTIEIVR